MTSTLLVAAVLAGLAAAMVLAPPRPARRFTVLPPPERAVPWPAGPTREPERAGAGRPRPVVTGAAALGVGAGVALLVGSTTGLMLGLLAVGPAWRWLSRLEPASVRRHREEVERGLPLLVDLLAACLRAGQAPGPALAAVTAALEPGPLRVECAAVVARLRLGGDPIEVWRTVGQHPQLGVLGRTITRALDGGASVADAMADLAGELRRSRRAEVQARARAVGARSAAPLGLCLLPAFVLVGVVPVVAGSLGALLRS